MNDFKKFIPISKLDPDKRLVYGYASTPDLDSQGDVVSLEAIKEALPEYLKFPTIREMHQPLAVGRTKSAEIDTKGLFIQAKIVDDNAWKKVKEGVFNGFSIGGYVKSKVGSVIKALDLTEISLVDVPANKSAVITLFKNDTQNSLEEDFKKYMVKFAFKKEVIQLDNDKKEELIVESTEPKVDGAEKSTEEATGEVTSDDTNAVSVNEQKEEGHGSEVVETDTSVVADKATTDFTHSTVTEPTEESSIDTTLEKIEKLEKKIEEALPVEKYQSIEKVNTAISKLASIVENLQERLEKVENTPAQSKTKASFLVSKAVGDVEVKEESQELKKAKQELADLMKIREINPERYSVEKMSVRAFELKDIIARLSK